MQERKDLAKEWTAFTAQEKASCARWIRDGESTEATYRANLPLALAARTVAIATRALPDSNALINRYWRECRTARNLFRELLRLAMLREVNWGQMLLFYNTNVNPANRTAGHIASITEATRRGGVARRHRIFARARLNGIDRWIRLDPIYRLPGPGVVLKVQEGDIPFERWPVSGGALVNNLVAEGVPGQWFAAAGSRMEGGDSEAYVWFRVDGNDNIAEVSICGLSPGTYLANSVLPVEACQKATGHRRLG